MESLLKLARFIILLLIVFGGLTGCDNNDPAQENIPETITKVTLVFKADNGATTVAVTANDPDGEGPLAPDTDIPIGLALNKQYSMQIFLTNGLVSPPLDLTQEVSEEGTNHMFFFGWTDGTFADPAGNGNIDNRSDVVNYIGTDGVDANGLPLGLSTEWTTSNTPVSGEFQVVLKHQPGLKTATSGSDVGETDLNITFDIVVQ